MNCFEVLGVNESASLDDVKQAWRKLASEHHPDRGGDAEKFNQAKQAYTQACEIVTQPKECTTCSGSGKVYALNGWSKIGLTCEECGGSGEISK